jgi:hypothetical protein
MGYRQTFTPKQSMQSWVGARVAGGACSGGRVMLGGGVGWGRNLHHTLLV